jgi:hypothetical protein
VIRSRPADSTRPAGRLELMRGDLHQNGGLGGKLLNIDEARAAL